MASPEDFDIPDPYMQRNPSEDRNRLEALIAPHTISRSSRDPNRGLYPNLRRNQQPAPSTSYPVFTTAAAFYQNFVSKKNSSDVAIPSTSRQGQATKHSKKTKYSNTLLNYFEVKTSSQTSDYSESESEKKDSDKVPEEELDPLFRDDAYFYGLFGATEQCELEENYFDRMPVFVLEQMLCLNPFPDFMKMRLVCKSWDTVISNCMFMEWKKAYYHYKLHKGIDSCFNNALKIMIPTPSQSFRCCLLYLLGYMAEKYHRKPSDDMMKNLTYLPHFKKACSALLDQFAEWKEETLNPWCVTTMLVILSEKVKDISNIFYFLLHSKSQSLFLDVLNFMYCIATFFLYFQTKFSTNHGIHHRLYSALYMFENSTPCVTEPKKTASTFGLQSCSNFVPKKEKLTFEQIRILQHKLEINQRVKIVAFAGTGKTTTLIHLAKLYPRLKFLNVVFNKSVCEHAKLVFPKNVECRTAHSLAYRAIGYKYRHKLSFKLKPHDMVSEIRVPYIQFGMHVYQFAKLTLDTIECFMASCDEELLLCHVPRHSGILRNLSCNDFFPVVPDNSLTELERNAVLQQAVIIWNMMLDITNPKVKIVHDAYLKFYQLSHPKLDSYDCIMIDEAQDCNKALLDVVMSQPKPVILVGDPNQQIYGFRGAKNALSGFQATHTYKLTKSFRFGHEIAYVASCCLETLQGTTNDTLVGTNDKCFVNGSLKGQCAIIARTNLTLLREAIRLCCTCQRLSFEPNQILGSFAGGIASYKLDQILDISRLCVGEKSKVKDRFVQRFSSFQDLQAYAKMANDIDLQTKIELVLQYGTLIDTYIETVIKTCSHPMELANIVFSTTHKAKGLEFETVRLMDDYWAGPEEENRNNHRLRDEYNLLYVALTRAKRSLFMSKGLLKILEKADEFFEYLESRSALPTFQECCHCICCSKQFFPEMSLVCCQKAIVLADGSSRSEGPICMACLVRKVSLQERWYYIAAPRLRIYRQSILTFLTRNFDMELKKQAQI